MPRELPEALETLIAVTEAKQPLGVSAPAGSWVVDALADGAAMYANKNEKLVAHVLHTVEITGDVTEKGGKLAIAADALKMAK